MALPIWELGTSNPTLNSNSSCQTQLFAPRPPTLISKLMVISRFTTHSKMYKMVSILSAKVPTPLDIAQMEMVSVTLPLEVVNQTIATTKSLTLITQATQLFTLAPSPNPSSGSSQENQSYLMPSSSRWLPLPKTNCHILIGL